jgi:hypothetical protein
MLVKFCVVARRRRSWTALIREIRTISGEPPCLADRAWPTLPRSIAIPEREMPAHLIRGAVVGTWMLAVAAPALALDPG